MLLKTDLSTAADRVKHAGPACPALVLAARVAWVHAAAVLEPVWPAAAEV